VACGAVGVGMAELARSQFFAALKAGMQTAFSAMGKSKGAPEP